MRPPGVSITRLFLWRQGKGRAVPYAFIAYYPTLYFFQLDAGPFAFLAYLTPLVAVLTTVVAVVFWSFGLRHYQSTGT